MTPSGQLFFQDQYLTQFIVEWNTVDGVLDITSIVKQPYQWGKADTGSIRNHILYRNGIITITRQLLRSLLGGYEIIAEGVSQYEDEIQMNFPCQRGPFDPFKYHLNNHFTEDCHGYVTDGPRWADPDEVNDANVVWSDVDEEGALTVGSITEDLEVLEFLDIWTE